jgi:cell division protein FtsL
MAEKERVKTTRDGQQEGKPLWLADLFALVLSFLPVALGVFIYLWPHMHLVRVAYEMHEVQMEERALIQENVRLRVEIASLRSPKRIDQIARQKLGLITPQNDQIILVKRRGEAHARRTTE